MREETGLTVTLGPVFAGHANFHDRENQSVGIWFWADRATGNPHAGSDATALRFFSMNNLPENMAFPTDLQVCSKLKRALDNDTLDDWLKTSECLSAGKGAW